MHEEYQEMHRQDGRVIRSIIVGAGSKTDAAVYAGTQSGDQKARDSHKCEDIHFEDRHQQVSVTY